MGSTYSFLAYGLGIRTAIPLPELMVGEAEEVVSIRFGSVDQPPAESSEKRWSYFSPKPQEDCLSWQGVGKFLVRGGSDIIVDPCPGLDEKMLRLFVLGPVLAVLLRQRGRLLLHASAVAMADGAVLFLGRSGWGKSTTAAALHARGHGLVTDDVAALRGEEGYPMVFPGFPRLKLWPEAVVSLGGDPEKLPRWNLHSEKRDRPTTHKFSSTPLPIKRIYVLASGDAAEISPLPPQEALVELVRHTYGSDYGLHSAMGVGSATHFFECASIVDKVRVCSLRRQKCLAQLPSVVELIEQDLARSAEQIVLSTG
jgi:hypothetical protein